MIAAAILGSALHQPPVVASLAAWWDASDSTTITHSSGSVSQITDKSGNGHTLTQGTSTLQPKINTETLNGLPVLDFDGGDRLVTTGGTLGKNCTGVTVYAVMRYPVSGIQVPLSAYAASARRIEIATYSSTHDFIVRRADGGSAANMPSSRNPIGAGYKIYTGRANYSSGALRQVWDRVSDGSGTSSTGTSSNTNLDSIAMGGRYTSAFPFDGQIAEILVYNVSHTDAEMRLVQDYLIRKWKIQIPTASGHIYWMKPISIGTDLSSLSTPSHMTLEYGWVFATTPATVGGITFTLASLDDETAEASGFGGFTHPDSGFQALLDGYEYALAPVTLTLTGLTAGVMYEVQMFTVDERTTSSLNQRKCYFYDTTGNESESFLAGDKVYVRGRFVAAGSTQVVKCYGLPSDDGAASAAGFLNAIVLRRFN